MILKLDESSLQKYSHWLADRDTALQTVLQTYGYPPLMARNPGFATLVHIILEQQVSLSSANAAFARLNARLATLTPASFLSLTDQDLRDMGFSRQKSQYTRLLAQTIANGTLQPEDLEHLPDEEVRQILTRLKGIGDWTVDIYLSECLLRPDILPKGDIALLEAFKDLYRLSARPGHEEFVHATNHWRPWRSIGTRLLWHFYLCKRGRTWP